MEYELFFYQRSKYLTLLNWIRIYHLHGKCITTKIPIHSGLGFFLSTYSPAPFTAPPPSAGGAGSGVGSGWGSTTGSAGVGGVTGSGFGAGVAGVAGAV